MSRVVALSGEASMNTEEEFWHYYVIQCCTDKSIMDEADKSKSEMEMGMKWDSEFKIRLPDELLIEILLRLPSKSVCRYRAVCRHWRSLMTNNHFISRYIHSLRKANNGSLFIPNSFTLIFQDRFFCYSTSSSSTASLQVSHIVNSEFASSKPCISLHFIPPLVQSKRNPKGKYVKIKDGDTVPVSVLASCRDLLLCSRVFIRTYYVINVVTKQLLVLPSAPPLDRLYSHCHSKPGLVCYHTDGDADANSYSRFKVILATYPPEYGSSAYAIRIFCSDSGEWTKLVVDWYPRTSDTNFCFCNMFPHNGMLHWVGGDSLVTLDLFNNNPHVKLSPVISLPVGESFLTPNIVGLMDGKLCVASLVRESMSSYIRVWQVEDHHKGVWRFLYRVLLPGRPFTGHIDLLNFHPYKRDAIFVQIGECGVYLFNLKNGDMSKCLESKLNERYSRKCVSASVVLFHQWFPTPLPSFYPLLDTLHTNN